MKVNKTEKDVLVWLATTAHGADVENKTYGEMGKAMKETLDELGFVIVPKEITHQMRFDACQALQEERQINIPASAMVNVWNALMKSLHVPNDGGSNDV